MADAESAPQGGALTIDDAVALLDRREADPAYGVSDELAPDAGADAQAEDEEFEGAASALEAADVWDEDPDGGEDEDEAEVEEEGDVDRLSAPRYWSKDAKARFAELDPELQAVVLSQEGPREEATAKAKAEAADVRSNAVDELGKAHALIEALVEAVPETVQRLQGQWRGTPDWAAIAQTHGVAAAEQARAHYAAEQARLARAQATAQAAEEAQQRLYVTRERELLGRTDPDLVDPDRGDALRGEIVDYLSAKGASVAQLEGISALEIHLARKAMLWDRAQGRAHAAAAAQRKPAPSNARPLARGGASAGPVDPKARRASQAANRFAKSRSVEDAVALLNAKGD